MMAGIEPTYATSRMEVGSNTPAYELMERIKKHRLEAAARLLDFGLDVTDGVMTEMEQKSYTGPAVVLTFRWEVRTKK
jgi:hypothetical protein